MKIDIRWIKTMLLGAVASAALLGMAAPTLGQTPPMPPPAAAPAVPAPPETLFTNVRVFDGKAARISSPTSVLVRGNAIAAIGAGAVASTNTTVIDGGGRTLMPGLIDAHWHAMMAAISLRDGLAAHQGYVNIVAARASAIEPRATAAHLFPGVITALFPKLPGGSAGIARRVGRRLIEAFQCS